MDYMESHFYFFLRYELDLDMNFGVGSFCMLLNFLIKPRDQSSTVDQESFLFLPKLGANGYYRSDLNPSEDNGKAAIDFGIWIRCLLQSVILYTKAKFWRKTICFRLHYKLQICTVLFRCCFWKLLL